MAVHPDLRPGDPVAIRTATTPKKLWAIAEVVSADPDGVAVMQDGSLVSVKHSGDKYQSHRQ